MRSDGSASRPGRARVRRASCARPRSSVVSSAGARRRSLTRRATSSAARGSAALRCLATRAGRRKSLRRERCAASWWAMGRADSLAKLALAYGAHLTRRRLMRPRPQLHSLLETYAADGIRAVDSAERAQHPRLVTCINCGLCALAAGRLGYTRLPDLASSYMRLYARLGEASSDVSRGEGDGPDLAAASSVCPVGLPLDEVAAAVRRMTVR